MDSLTDEKLFWPSILCGSFYVQMIHPGVYMGGIVEESPPRMNHGGYGRDSNSLGQINVKYDRQRELHRKDYKEGYRLRTYSPDLVS